MLMRRTPLLVLLGTLMVLVTVACSADGAQSTPTATAVAATAATAATTTGTIESGSSSPTSAATPDTRPPGQTVDLGRVRLTNVRIEPGSGTLRPGDQIVVTGRREFLADGDIRSIFIPVLSDEAACFAWSGDATAEGDFSFVITAYRDVPECPAGDPIAITEILARAFDANASDESTVVQVGIPVDLTIDRSTAN